MNITHLNHEVTERIDNIINKGFNILVGDANGVDQSIQLYLSSKNAKSVTIFCSGDYPRNNIGQWPVQRIETPHTKGSRAYFTAKDIRMAEIADYGLMIWDTKSTGTLNNIIELLVRNKKSVVYVNKTKIFINIFTVVQLETLLSFMSEHSKKKANEKIKLFDRINTLKQEQLPMAFQ